MSAPPDDATSAPPGDPVTALPSCRAVLFDLDGVLVHSADAVHRSWRGWAADNGLSLDVVERAAHGRRTVDAIDLLAPELDATAEAARLESEQALDTADVSAGAGAADLLGWLRPGEWGVVTSGMRALALARLAAAGLPVPGVIVAGDDVARGKPAPDGYLLGAAALGREPSECVVIEDAAPGVRAAHEAGSLAIGVTNGRPAGDLRAADLLVTALADLRLSRGAGGLTLSRDLLEPVPGAMP